LRMRRTLFEVLPLLLVGVFLLLFFVYPLFWVFRGSLFYNGRLSGQLFYLIFKNPALREGLLNSLKIAISVTAFTFLISFPLAWFVGRYKFAGKGLLSSVLLLPMIMPPFVGAVGMRRILARFGALNLLLIKAGIIKEGIDWLAGGFGGVVIMETLHLYPLMFLTILSSVSLIDASCEEAARVCGATPLRCLLTVSLPALKGGILAGGLIVFVWSFSELGTPLVFEYRRVVPVQVFDMVKDIASNPMGYALVMVLLLVTFGAVFGARSFMRATHFSVRGRLVSAERQMSKGGVVLFYIYALTIFALGITPHISVFLTSVAEKWFMTILPTKFTGWYYKALLSHPLTFRAIRTSFALAGVSCIIDLALGGFLAYMMAKHKGGWMKFLDSFLMLPLALPGIILAFGYVGTFSGTIIDPFRNPIVLLIVAYSIRRLPYTVRTIYAGFQRLPKEYEEASRTLGGDARTTFRKILLPLIAPSVFAGALLAFAFALLEVSSSLILAMREEYYPITKAIYALLGRIVDGAELASAMGTVGVVLLGASIILATKLTGRRMGELFRLW